ncbi:hypothetical protein D3C87_1981770 [compost metagenome]
MPLGGIRLRFTARLMPDCIANCTAMVEAASRANRLVCRCAATMARTTMKPIRITSPMQNRMPNSPAAAENT